MENGPKIKVEEISKTHIIRPRGHTTKKIELPIFCGSGSIRKVDGKQILESLKYHFLHFKERLYRILKVIKLIKRPKLSFKTAHFTFIS